MLKGVDIGVFYLKMYLDTDLNVNKLQFFSNYNHSNMPKGKVISQITSLCTLENINGIKIFVIDILRIYYHP